MFKTIASHMHYDGFYPKKIPKIPIAGEVVENLEPLITLGGIVK